MSNTESRLAVDSVAQELVTERETLLAEIATRQARVTEINEEFKAVRERLEAMLAAMRPHRKARTKKVAAEGSPAAENPNSEAESAPAGDSNVVTMPETEATPTRKAKRN